MTNRSAGRDAFSLALLYGAAAAASAMLLRQPGTVANLWLANAVAVAWLLSVEPRRWPGLVAAAMLGNLAVNLALDFHWSTAVAFLPVNALEIVLATLLLRRVGIGAFPVRSPHTMLKLLALGAVLPQFVGACIGAQVMVWLGMGPFTELWLNWFLGSVIGSLSVLPLAIGLRTDEPDRIAAALGDPRFAAFALLTSGVVLLALAHLPHPFVFIALPLLTGGFFLSLHALLALVLIASLAIALAIGIGIFVPSPYTAPWQQASVYVAYAASLVPAQLLGAALAELRDSHERLARATAELQRANEGLEQFVRIASHDLREPLNTIVQFSSLIEQDHGSQLAPPARTWLAHVVRAGTRMRTLIDDVLAYVRTRDEAHAPGGPVALDAVLADAQQALAGRILERGATVEVDADLPVVRGHEAPLVLLFQNLLSNALKFVPPDRVPVVRVGARSEAGQAVIEVADNGIGVAAGDLPKLFQPFARLHLRRHYEGTGLGLALVRQIAQAHGGSVVMESAPGEGTRVVVRLPLAFA